jgi:hypothetical protein
VYGESTVHQFKYPFSLEWTKTPIILCSATAVGNACVGSNPANDIVFYFLAVFSFNYSSAVCWGVFSHWWTLLNRNDLHSLSACPSLAWRWRAANISKK